MHASHIKHIRHLPLVKQSLLLLILAIIAALIFEHSQFDIAISQLFYNQNHWLIAKDTQPYAFIFYDLPKMLIILSALLLIMTLLWRYWQDKRYSKDNNNPQIRGRLLQFSNRDLSYLLLVLIIVPSITASLKSITHVSCPNHLLLFNGEFAYLSIWQNILAKTPAKCFPAAHASAGFALYALAYLPQLQKYRGRITLAVSVLGWSMGLYKMSIGDHFFSHTLVSMLLSWSIACGIAAFIFSTKNPKRHALIVNQF